MSTPRQSRQPENRDEERTRLLEQVVEVMELFYSIVCRIGLDTQTPRLRPYREEEVGIDDASFPDDPRHTRLFEEPQQDVETSVHSNSEGAPQLLTKEQSHETSVNSTDKKGHCASCRFSTLQDIEDFLFPERKYNCSKEPAQQSAGAINTIVPDSQELQLPASIGKSQTAANNSEENASCEKSSSTIVDIEDFSLPYFKNRHSEEPQQNEGAINTVVADFQGFQLPKSTGESQITVDDTDENASCERSSSAIVDIEDTLIPEWFYDEVHLIYLKGDSLELQLPTSTGKSQTTFDDTEENASCEKSSSVIVDIEDTVIPEWLYDEGHLIYLKSESPQPEQNVTAINEPTQFDSPDRESRPSSSKPLIVSVRLHKSCIRKTVDRESKNESVHEPRGSSSSRLSSSSTQTVFPQKKWSGNSQKECANEPETSVTTDEINADNLCFVCKMPFELPVKLHCSHIFCLVCAKDFVRIKKACALCDEVIYMEFMEDPGKFLIGDYPEPLTEHSWFHLSQEGWWRFTPRKEAEIEGAFRSGVSVLRTTFHGLRCLIDLENSEMTYGDPMMSRTQKIKRDLSTSAHLGMAGVSKPKTFLELFEEYYARFNDNSILN